MTPVETLGCGCIIDSLGQTVPCVHHANVRRADTQDPIAALIAIMRVGYRYREGIVGPDVVRAARVDEWANELEALRPVLEQERARLEQAAAREKCDKCGRMAPRQFIAVEVKDGAPIDDPAGFMWCIVCHDQRVVAELCAALTAEREARQEAERQLAGTQRVWAKDMAALTTEREARQQAEARATYEIGAMNEVLRQAERERDEATRAREAALQKRDRDGLFSALKAKDAEIDTLRGSRKEMRAQLTASERARETAEQDMAVYKQAATKARCDECHRMILDGEDYDGFRNPRRDEV